MKNILLFILLFPLGSSAQYNFYYGNIHAHTNYSDGNKDSITTGIATPGASYNYAKSSYHFDFLGISEHNHFTSTNNPGMLLPKYAAGLYQADTSNVNGTFVAMYGLEWGTISTGGHIVTYGYPNLIGWETISGSPNYGTYCNKGDYNSYWNIVNAVPNCFSTLAHPQTGDYQNLIETSSAFNLKADSTIVGIAIRSGEAFSTTNNYSDLPASSYETEYKRALAKGYHVGPTIDHDNHYTNFGRTNESRTVILSTNLHRDSLVSAYKQRRFYASDDWNAQVTFTINGNVMGSNFTTPSNSSINVSITDLDASDPTSNIQIFYGVPGSNATPTILTSISNNSSLSFTHTTTNNQKFYYYAKITQTDGDIIWSSPIWIKRFVIPLPLDITSFNAYANNTQVKLDFTLENIENVSSIKIEHSINTHEFNTLATFPLENKALESFNYIHTTPQIGTNYYRLKYTDIDNKEKYSYINAVDIQNPTAQFTLFPNPTTDKITLSYNSNENTRATIKIYNQEGREVFFQNVIINQSLNNLDLNVSHLAAGMYYIVLQKNDSRLIDSKFIKQ